MKTIVESFKDNVKKFPNEIAVNDKEGFYSYKELDEISTHIACFILNYCKNKGIEIENNIKQGKNGERITVMFPRKKLFLAILLGIQKAGCCFINIDPAFPTARKNHIIEDSQCSFLISSLELDTSDVVGDVFNIEDILKSKIDIKDDIDLSKLDNEGVILYTSGSTGVSKGVLHKQRFYNSTLFNYWQNFYEFSSDDKVGCMAGFSFTIMFCDLLTPLIYGTSVYILDEEERLDVSEIYHLIQNQGITVMFMPPKVLSYVAKTYDDLNIKCLWTGGEKLYNITKRDYTIIENFGCSEASFMISREVKDDKNSKLLGKPHSHLKTLLFDENGNKITESGIVGELCVISENIALKYLNLQEQTDAKFINCSDDKRSRMFKTGDLMSFTDDGQLEYHGRNDYMVKLNGYRVELGEVEREVLQVNNISENVCVVRNINGGDNLCCFYVTESEIDNEEDFVSHIKDKISEKLTEYMIPSIFMRIDELPRNINGKIDRSNFPEIKIHKAEFEKASNELEEKLCRGFAKVLNMDYEDIGVNDNFYDLGGNSILTMELLDYLKIPELSSMDIFKGQTVKKIAELFDSNDMLNEEQLFEVEKEEMKRCHELTPFQSRLLSDQACDFNSTVWNIPTMFAFTDVDAVKLKDAVQKTLDNHPSLSVTFRKDENGNVSQYYSEGLLPKIIIEEISEKDLKGIIPELVDAFDVFGGPLTRFRIFKTELKVYLFIDIHHLLVDGTSSNILHKEIVSAYDGENIEFNDFYFTFLKELEDMDESEYSKAKEYYSDKYGELSDWTLVPKTDLMNKGYGMEITGICPIGMDVNDIEKAEQYFKTSKNVLAVAASLKAQSIHSKSNKVLVNWVYNNRNNHIYDSTVGCLIKSFPVGINMDNIESNHGLLEEIKKQVIDGIAYGSYEYLCENYESFTTDTLFVNYVGSLRNSEGLQALNPETIDLPRPKDIAKMRVAIAILEDENGMILTGVEYCSDLYSKETAIEYHKLLNEQLVSLIEEALK